MGLDAEKAHELQIHKKLLARQSRSGRQDMKML